MADAGEGQEAPARRNARASRGSADAWKTGLPARAAWRTTVGGGALAHLEHAVGMAHLVDQRGAQRPGRDDVAIADAAAGIDHQQRVVDMDAARSGSRHP